MNLIDKRARTVRLLLWLFYELFIKAMSRALSPGMVNGIGLGEDDLGDGDEGVAVLEGALDNLLNHRHFKRDGVHLNTEENTIATSAGVD